MGGAGRVSGLFLPPSGSSGLGHPAVPSGLGCGGWRLGLNIPEHSISILFCCPQLIACPLGDLFHDTGPLSWSWYMGQNPFSRWKEMGAFVLLAPRQTPGSGGGHPQVPPCPAGLLGTSGFLAQGEGGLRPTQPRPVCIDLNFRPISAQT